MLRLFCFILFRFHHFAFIEAAALRSIVLRYACAPTATRSYLTTDCALFCFCFAFSFSLEMSLFQRIFVPFHFFCVESSVLCVFSSHSFWTSSSLDVPAGVTQEEGHTGFLIHLLSAVRALIFLARRIQPFLSLVDREVEFCVLTI